jgi:hypothetical protein
VSPLFFYIKILWVQKSLYEGNFMDDGFINNSSPFDDYFNLNHDGEIDAGEKVHELVFIESMQSPLDSSDTDYEDSDDDVYNPVISIKR